MHAWALRSRLLQTALPIAGGTCIAALSVGLMKVSPIWTAMLIGSALVLIPALVVKDRLMYWLVLFLLALPFDVTKMFMEPDRAIALVETVGAPAGPISPYLHLLDLAFLPLFGTWLLGKIRRKERIWFPGIHWLPLAFLALATVTALVAPIPYFAFLGILKQAKYFAIYVVAADVLDVHRHGRTILVVLLLTLGLQGATTLARYQFQYFKPLFGQALGRSAEDARGEAEGEGTRRVQTEDPESPDRGFGTFYHANVTAIHLELLLPFALILALGSRSTRWRAAYACLFLLGAAAHYVTFSRAGLAAILLSTAVCLIVASIRGLIPRRWVPLLAAVAALGILALVPVAVHYMQTRPAETAYHVDHVRHGLAIALEHPWFGVGLNNSSFVRNVLVARDLFYGGQLLPIHSQHLVILSETGVIGYVLYVGFFVLVALEALRRSRSSHLIVRTFSIGVVGAFSAVFVHVTTDWLGFEAAHVMMWLYAGLIVSMRREPGLAAGPRPTTDTLRRPLARRNGRDRGRGT
jgi:hypothetical protein